MNERLSDDFMLWHPHVEEKDAELSSTVNLVLFIQNACHLMFLLVGV